MLEDWKEELLKDGVKHLIEQARTQCAGKSNAPAVEKELGYFINNIDRMQYGTFRARGFFIGSGVMEAGCKTVIGARCKQSGMFWGCEGAQKHCRITLHRRQPPSGGVLERPTQ